MPIIYLSPSTQENNLYVNGGTEEEWMNRLADAMEPYLTASGIPMGSGRWLSLEVDSPEVVEDIKTLLMLKRPLKKQGQA